jgi:tetratricopeptide (TPR) repeat protein
MKYIFLSYFLIFFSCTNQENNIVKEELQSELVILSKAISVAPNSSENYLNRAKYFTSKDNLESALLDYKECVSLSPDNYKYHLYLANTYFEIAKYDITQYKYPNKAFIHVEKSLNIQPDYIPSLLLKAELHLSAINQEKEAFECLNRIINIDYNIPKAHLLKGYVYFKLGDNLKAMQFFYNSIDIDPTMEEAYLQLGLIFQQMEDSTALIHYRNVLKINPKNKLALFGIGSYYQESEQWNKSISAYIELLDYYPTYANAYYNIGFIHIKLGLYDIAVDDFSQAISFNPDFYEAYFSRGHCFETLGNVTNAELDYRKAILINSEYQYAKDALTALLKNNKNIK